MYMVHCSKKGSRQYNKTRNTVARYWLAIWFTAQTGWSLHGSDRSMALPFLLWEGICQDVLVHVLTQALDRNTFILDVLGFGMSRCQPHLSYTKGELRDISPTCPSWNLAPSLDFSNFGRSSIFFCAASCLSRLFSCSWKMKTYNKLKLESYHDVGLDQITQDHGSWWDMLYDHFHLLPVVLAAVQVNIVFPDPGPQALHVFPAVGFPVQQRPGKWYETDY